MKSEAAGREHTKCFNSNCHNSGFWEYTKSIIISISSNPSTVNRLDHADGNTLPLIGTKQTIREKYSTRSRTTFEPLSYSTDFIQPPCLDL